MTPGKLALIVAVLLLIAAAAVVGFGLNDGASQDGGRQETQQQRAFLRWRDSALPVILRYRQALLTTQAQKHATKLQARVSTAERARAALALLVATLGARPPISSNELRLLNTMLLQAIRLARAAEANYAIGLRNHRAALTRRAKLQLDHSSAVMFYFSLRANALGAKLFPAPGEG